MAQPPKTIKPRLKQVKPSGLYNPLEHPWMKDSEVSNLVRFKDRNVVHPANKEDYYTVSTVRKRNVGLKREIGIMFLICVCVVSLSFSVCSFTRYTLDWAKTLNGHDQVFISPRINVGKRSGPR